MSVSALPSPREFAEQIGERLWFRLSQGTWAVQAVRLDSDGRRRCAAWNAQWYEVAAYFTHMNEPLGKLEQLLAALPGCVRTTQVTGYPARIRDPDWPGWARRRGTRNLRPQVLALFADPPGSSGRPEDPDPVAEEFLRTHPLPPSSKAYRDSWGDR